jgi:hypothetical protein
MACVLRQLKDFGGTSRRVVIEGAKLVRHVASEKCMVKVQGDLCSLMWDRVLSWRDATELDDPELSAEIMCTLWKQPYAGIVGMVEYLAGPRVTTVGAVVTLAYNTIRDGAADDATFKLRREVLLQVTQHRLWSACVVLTFVRNQGMRLLYKMCQNTQICSILWADNALKQLIKTIMEVSGANPSRPGARLGGVTVPAAPQQDVGKRDTAVLSACVGTLFEVSSRIISTQMEEFSNLYAGPLVNVLKMYASKELVHLQVRSVEETRPCLPASPLSMEPGGS